jgi:hypothetical protein
MTEAQVRQATVAFPGVNVRALTHVIEGAAAEAAAGLVATRAVCGWRVVVDRTPPGDWRVVATPLSQGTYPMHPPNEVIVVAMCIATEAGAPQDLLVDNTSYDLATGEFRVMWAESDAALKEHAQ